MPARLYSWSLRRPPNESPILCVHGELDIAAACPLAEAITTFARRSSTAATVELDIAGVTFLDAAGIGVLVACQRRLDADGRRLRLSHTPPAVERVLRVAGVDDALTIRATER